MKVLIVGGGYLGTIAARKLQGPLHKRGHELVVVNPENFMVYQPFLPEAASGNIEPRHVVVPLRTVLGRTRLITGTVVALNHERRVASVAPADGPPQEVAYDLVVVGLGSVSRVLPVPGLAE